MAKVKYKFDHKLKIIFERIKGEITFDEIFSYQKNIISDPEYNSSYSIYSDIRDLNFKLSQTEIITMFNLLKEVTSEKNIDKKCAFITNKPQEVVNSELIKFRMKKFSSINIKTFSTKEAAFQWLNINEDYII